MKDKYNAFSGVFVPTFLSVIGVILFLRLGFIVGSAGILGSIAIIILAVSITVSTGLSLSSITSNIRIHEGGAYSIISQKLGLEVGGSVGIPLYLAQVFSVVLYIYGFSEAWLSLFPGHTEWMVVFAVFCILFILTFISTRLAVRTQMFVFILVIGALVSVIVGPEWLNNALRPQIVWDFSKSSFWELFALFFPAVTGLMAGIGMSGELSDPKKQIPKGVLLGLLVTTGIYILLAVIYGYSASSIQLINNKTIIVDIATWSPIVLLGILAASFSSALTTFVAAPRVLHAMSEHHILPFSKYFAVKHNQEPRHATLFTSVLIMISLSVSNLDSIAPILTMFMLISYIMINMVIFIEKALGLPSFRPTFRVPMGIPLYGALASVVSMFLINVVAGAISLLFLFIIYVYLVHKNLKPKEGDVRSGLFLGIAEWASRKIEKLPESTEHTWKPSILIPVNDTDQLLGVFPFAKSLAYPNGSIAVLGVKTSNRDGFKDLHELVKRYGEEGIFTSSSIIHAKSLTEGTCLAVEALNTKVFHHNILLVTSPISKITKKESDLYFQTSKDYKIGLIFMDLDNVIGFGSERDIHVWLSSTILKKDIYQERPYDLALLVAYLLRKDWNGRLRVWMAVDRGQENKARYYIKKLLYEARFLNNKTDVNITIESFKNAVKKAPDGDIHIIPVSNGLEMERYRKKLKRIRKSFLYICDSETEDVIA